MTDDPDEELSHRQSLGLIEQMIATAKNEHQEKGEGWLIWGWLLFLASVASVILLYVPATKYIGWVWTAVLPLGGVLYIFFHVRTPKKERVKTYVEELLNRFETGFFISLFSIVAGSYISGNNSGFGYFYILYAFWMFIHGSAIRFKPLIVGAVVNWIAAVAIFAAHDFKYIMIISAIAILAGYLVPGYLLRRQYKRNIHQN